MPESSIRQFATDILRGLSYSHCQGVIYSDLKPANVLIAEHGQLKLSNFGQAQRVKDIAEQPPGPHARAFVCARSLNPRRRASPAVVVFAV